MNDYEIDKAVLLIETAGKKLNLPSNTIARGMVIYHHFKLCKIVIDYEDGLVAAAAIGLAAKVDEGTFDDQNIIIVFWNMLCENKRLPKLNSEDFKELEKSLVRVQNFICRALRFELNHILAHQYLVHYLRSLHKKQEFKYRWDIFVNLVWKIISSAYLANSCLNYEASEIAVASIHMASMLCRIKVESPQKWHQCLSVSVTEEKLEQIVGELLLVCGVSTVSIDEA